MTIDAGQGNGPYRHPEWRRLYDALAPRLVEDLMLPYEELSALAGINIRSARGRAQFLRFRDEVLTVQNLYFDNVYNKGYRVVFPKEHITCSFKQLERGRRRIRRAGEILEHTRFDRLTHEQNRVHADAMVRVTRVFDFVTEERVPIRRLEREQKRLPSPAL